MSEENIDGEIFQKEQSLEKENAELREMVNDLRIELIYLHRKSSCPIIAKPERAYNHICFICETLTRADKLLEKGKMTFGEYQSRLREKQTQ